MKIRGIESRKFNEGLLIQQIANLLTEVCSFSLILPALTFRISITGEVCGETNLFQ